jgi:hypothetical protein
VVSPRTSSVASTPPSRSSRASSLPYSLLGGRLLGHGLLGGRLRRPCRVSQVVVVRVENRSDGSSDIIAGPWPPTALSSGAQRQPDVSTMQIQVIGRDRRWRARCRRPHPCAETIWPERCTSGWKLSQSTSYVSLRDGRVPVLIGSRPSANAVMHVCLTLRHRCCARRGRAGRPANPTKHLP